MSTRTINFAALLGAYGAISLLASSGRLDMALYGLPIVLVTVIAAVRKWNSPRIISVVGLAAFGAVCLTSIDVPDMTALALGAVQAVMVTLYGLSLVVDPSIRDRALLQDTLDGAPMPRDIARPLVGRELRRSRRTRSPLSILSLDGTASVEPSERHALARELQRDAREFDTVFEAPTGELAILCVGTDGAGARRYADRLRTAMRATDFSITSFPEDAVTLQGLFDTVAQGTETARPRTEAVVVAE